MEQREPVTYAEQKLEEIANLLRAISNKLDKLDRKKPGVKHPHPGGKK